MRVKWKLWLIPVVAVLALGVFKNSGSWGKDEVPQQPVNVQTVVAKTVDKVKKENTLALTGSLEAIEEAIISAKTGGRVSRVVVENGDAVAAGKPLVLLENEEFNNLLTINRAALKKAEANLASVRTNYSRYKQLYEEGAIAQKDFEDMETGLMVAEADADSAAAAVANAEESLRNATITSPLNGVVADRNVTIGQVVSPGIPLMAVKDISSVYVQVNIEQKDLALVKTGQQANVTIDAYGDRNFAGVVDIINPAANKSARVFETKIKVKNPEHLLKPGMFAKVSIRTGEAEEVAAVPQEALTGKQGMYFVYLVEGDKVKRQQVEIGQMIGQLVEIKSGLAQGQKIAVTNVNKLKDGDRIKIAD